MVSYSTFSLIAPLAGLFFLLLFKIAVAPAEMERDVLALVPNPEPTMIRLEDVAAELLARLRGKPAYEFLSYNTDGSSDMLRRAADYVTNYYGVYGRIPGTTVRQFIPPGTHFMRLNSGSMLVATSDTSKGVADFEDLAMPKEEVNDVLSDVSSRIIEIAKSHQ